MPKALEKTRKAQPKTRTAGSKAGSTAVAAKPPRVRAEPAPPAPKRPKSFEDVIGDLTGPPREIARQLRQLVFDVIPGVTETAYGGSKVQILLYSLGGPTKTLCGIQPSTKGCLLFLHNVTPEDAQTLLIEGEGKHSRHVCVSTMTNLVVRDLRRLLTLTRRRAKA